MNIQTKIAGKYKLAIKRGDDIVQETPWFHNTILDQGLDRMGTTQGATVVGSAQVGTGTTPPATTQTALTDFLAGVTGSANPSSTVSSGSPNYQSLKTWIFTFPQGAVVGTIAEVGVGWAATAGSNLFSRELIRDSGGGPITLSLTAIDQLIVYYELTFTPTLTDGSGSVVLDSITYNYTSRILRAASFASSTTNVLIGQSLARITNVLTYQSGTTLAAITANTPNGTAISSGGASSIATVSYTSGNYYLDKTIFWDVGRANHAGGIGALYIELLAQLTGPEIYYQMVFATPIPKDNTQQLTLVLRFSWARA
jgi:hypothetical protein